MTGVCWLGLRFVVFNSKLNESAKPIKLEEMLPIEEEVVFKPKVPERAKPGMFAPAFPPVSKIKPPESPYPIFARALEFLVSTENVSESENPI